MDLNMPVMDGRQASIKMQNHFNELCLKFPDFVKPPVFILTSDCSIATAQELVDLPIEQVFYKLQPEVEIEIILNCIKLVQPINEV